MIATWLPCIHRGRILPNGRCFCRQPDQAGTVEHYVCDNCPVRETNGETSPMIGSPPPRPRRPPTVEDLPCVHRTDESIRSESCRTCSNLFGLTEIDVYGCALHAECTLPRSEVMRNNEPNRLAKWCTSCKDRKTDHGEPPSDSSPPPPSSPG